MTTRIALSVFLAFALVLPASSALADEEFDWNILGWYIQMNGFAALNNFEDDLRDITNGNIKGNDGSGLNVRGGYQILTWLAVEGMYEYGTTLDASVPTPAGRVKDGFTLDTHNIIGSVKLSLPFWRIQPYIIAGVGAQRSKFDSQIINPWVADQNAWNFVGRPGVGIDFVVLEHWTVNFEAAGMLGLTNYKSRLGGELDRLFYTTIGGGVKYRF
jgi:opacity protein-like surface antigen